MLSRGERFSPYAICTAWSYSVGPIRTKDVVNATPPTPVMWWLSGGNSVLCIDYSYLWHHRCNTTSRTPRESILNVARFAECNTWPRKQNAYSSKGLNLNYLGKLKFCFKRTIVLFVLYRKTANVSKNMLRGLCKLSLLIKDHYCR